MGALVLGGASRLMPQTGAALGAGITLLLFLGEPKEASRVGFSSTLLMIPAETSVAKDCEVEDAGDGATSGTLKNSSCTYKASECD